MEAKTSNVPSWKMSPGHIVESLNRLRSYVESIAGDDRLYISHCNGDLEMVLSCVLEEQGVEAWYVTVMRLA
jgi:hypothetical protein